nr:MAG TPA: minor structural protein [Caudoviricetes sp.]
MDFLKEILGEELFAQVKEKIDAHNGDEANKDKQIKIGNLGSGEYVGKGKYDALQEAMTGKNTEITNANNLIAELKKASKGNEDMQKKFTEYEAENAKLQAALAETKLKAALKVALMTEGAVDVDYLTFKLNEKLKEKGETLEVDENDNIKGWNDKLSGLKVQFPTMFKATSEGGMKILENRLQHGSNEQTVTKEQFQKMGIEERSKFKAENESLYNQYAGKQ